MVNKGVLRKLPDFELEKYLKEGNRFVPEAVQMAFEVLEERGRVFTEHEKTTVHQLIQHKKDAEQARLDEEKEVWKDHITQDPSAIKLFPRDLILIISLILGTIPGSILLGLNFIKLKKYTQAILTFILGFIFLPIQAFLLPLIYEIKSKRHFAITKSPEFLVAGLGAMLLLILWILFTPKKLPYRAASYIFPVILSLVMLILIATNYQGWFSSHILVSLAK
ncbi:hypothetical protein ABXT08_13165 [Chryseobacterium sp. NRRL B-14859]|uniref:hypothetical protein n=1 Tax=Chryseobacterium sp. NRRL B-14859 TaxID=1562763 RepID=UPI003394E952